MSMPDLSSQTFRVDLQERMKLFETLLQNMTEGVLVTDPQGDILLVNASFSTITGYAQQDVLGKNPRLLNSGRHAPAFYQQMWDSLKMIGQWRGEIENRRKDGTIYPELLNIVAMQDADGQPWGYIGIFSDLTIHKEDDNFFKYVATHDPLTDLPNRSHFFDSLNQAVFHSKLHKQSMAVLFIDLDGFKLINDTYGHELGDQVLIEVADKLVECVPAKDSVARMGGDEFTIIMENIANPEEAAAMAETVLHAISKLQAVPDDQIDLTASIGISLYPTDLENSEKLLNQADQAMYKVKELGKNGYTFFSDEPKN